MPVSPSAISGAIGTRRNARRLPSGTSAQSSASSFQCEMPTSEKNSVESSTTPTWPQQ